MVTDRTGLVFRWLWGLFHLAGLAAWALWGPEAFRVYMWAFFALELVGIVAGRPMTRSVRGLVKDTWHSPLSGLVTVAVVFGWCLVFAVGATFFGPFAIGLNAFLVMLIFGIWIIPHFFGNLWG